MSITSFFSFSHNLIGLLSHGRGQTGLPSHERGKEKTKQNKEQNTNLKSMKETCKDVSIKQPPTHVPLQILGSYI